MKNNKELRDQQTSKGAKIVAAPDTTISENSQLLEIINPTSSRVVNFASNILALATGVTKDGKKGALVSLGRIAQAALQDRFVHQLDVELKDYIKMGLISEETKKSPMFRDSVIELLKYIESDDVSEEKFLAMKMLLLKMAEDGMYEEGRSYMPKLIMDTLHALSPLEMLVLQATYIATEGEVYDGSKEIFRQSMGERYAQIVKCSGIDREYVESAWKSLGTNPTIIIRGNGLTPLGVKICEFIKGYKGGLI